MLILGLHFGHDANISVFKGSDCLAFYEKERHCRLRHASGLTGAEILGVLERLGLKMGDVDICAITTTQYYPIYDWDGDLHFDFIEPINTNGNKINMSESQFLEQNKVTLRWLSWSCGPPASCFAVSPIFPFEVDDSVNTITLSDIANKIPAIDYRSQHFQNVKFSISGLSPKRSVYLCHHLAHASYSYGASPYDNALVISIDGTTANNFSGGGIYYAKGGKCYPIVPHGFWGGGFYGYLSQVMGLGDAGGEGKLMGLAAYGLPVYADRHLVGSSSEMGGKHGHEIARHWLDNHVLKDGRTFPEWDGWSYPPQLIADIAASAQWIFQENVLATVDAAVTFAKRTNLPYDGICLAGGCALNCPSNSLVAAKYGNVFIPPAVNDEGLSMGAAFSVASTRKRSATETPTIAFMGGDYSREVDDVEMYYRDHIKLLASGDEALSELAIALAQGKVAGFHYGKSEAGPRALGHRSILASAQIAENHKRVNKIKDREQWRPLAPIVTERSLDLFSHVPQGSHFMLFNARVKGKDLPSVTHADGSARVQVATPECGDVYLLLVLFGKISGHEVLLNTSFNNRGEPIVERPVDTILAFITMDLDLLYMDGKLFGKVSKTGSLVDPASPLTTNAPPLWGSLSPAPGSLVPFKCSSAPNGAPIMSRESSENDDGKGNRLQHIIGSRKIPAARHQASSQATNWQQDNPMPKGYDPPAEASHLLEAIKMFVILSLTVCISLYGVYMLSDYRDAQNKLVPIYGDTAAPLPGRGAGPPSVTWGGGNK